MCVRPPLPRPTPFTTKAQSIRIFFIAQSRHRPSDGMRLTQAHSRDGGAAGRCSSRSCAATPCNAACGFAASISSSRSPSSRPAAAPWCHPHARRQRMRPCLVAAAGPSRRDMAASGLGIALAGSLLQLGIVLPAHADDFVTSASGLRYLDLR